MYITKIENKEAIQFYDELLTEKVLEKNEEVRVRLIEVQNWKNAFVVLMNHASHFRIKVLKKENLIPILKKYNFENNLYYKLVD